MFGNAVLNTSGPGGCRCGMHWQSGNVHKHRFMMIEWSIRQAAAAGIAYCNRHREEFPSWPSQSTADGVIDSINTYAGLAIDMVHEHLIDTLDGIGSCEFSLWAVSGSYVGYFPAFSFTRTNANSPLLSEDNLWKAGVNDGTYNYKSGWKSPRQPGEIYNEGTVTGQQSCVKQLYISTERRADDIEASGSYVFICQVGNVL